MRPSSPSQWELRHLFARLDASLAVAKDALAADNRGWAWDWLLTRGHNPMDLDYQEALRLIGR